MSLADEAAEKPRNGMPCSVGLFLASLSPEEAAEVEDALRDPRVRVPRLLEHLRKRGHDVTYSQTWGRHKRGECRCG